MLDWIRRLGSFLVSVLRNFKNNNGLLLAGALGYNTLLSIVPLFALIMVGLSHVFDEQTLLATVEAEAAAVFPGKDIHFRREFASFLEQREVVGTVGLLAMLFFSTLGFRMLEEAMRTVFHRNRKPRGRHWILSFVLPLAYVSLVALGVLMATVVMVFFDAFPDEVIRVLGFQILAQDVAIKVIKVIVFVGLVVFLSSFYWVMPQVRVAPRRAVVGGLVAAVLWEAVRSLLVWYFANLSLVDVVYGSLAAVIIILLSLEIAAIILLLGAEVIAQLERTHEQNIPWYVQPRD